VDLVRRSFGPLFREMSGHGAHEVIVESPNHARPLALSPLDDIALALKVMRRRCAALGTQPSFEVVQLFQNHGSRAGASLQHPHFQIVAAPVVPRQMRIKYAVAAEYYHATGSSVYSDLCRDELASGERLVFANAEFVAFAPFASRVAFETWIIPRAGRGKGKGANQHNLAWHLADMTWGWVNPGYERGAVYRNLDASLSRLPVAILYIVANIVLGIHLFHGFWSLFQSLGWKKKSYGVFLDKAARVIAIAIFLGYASIPLAILFGYGKEALR